MIGILTGVQKSGNSWIGAMVRQLVFGDRDRNWFGRWLRTHRVNAAAIAYNRSATERITAEGLLSRLVSHPPTARWPKSIDGQRLADALRPVAAAVRMEWARGSLDPGWTVREIQQQLIDRISAGPNGGSSPWVGLSKHTPVPTLLQSFPTARVVWIVRDPRDSLVSFFFHDLATLKRDKLPWIFAADDDRPRVRDDAARAMLSARVATIGRYYDLSLSADTANDDRVLAVRYEEMLADPAGGLGRISDFLELDTGTEPIKLVAAQFDCSDRSREENSFIRTASTGDWRNYFGAAHRDLFDAGIRRAVDKLGYDPAGAWTDNLPVDAVCSFDLSKFRPRSSAVYAFEDLWLDDETLQRRFPLPHHDFGSGSYYQWLASAEAPEIRAWFQAADRLIERFGCVTDERRSDAENRLGF